MDTFTEPDPAHRHAFNRLFCRNGESPVYPAGTEYTNIFSMDDVPEPGREAVARQVADKIIAGLTRPESSVHV